MILEFLFYCFLAYLVFRLVFNFILPIYRTTRQIKKGFTAMKNQMNQQAQPDNSTSANKMKPTTENVGEYIDFEDIK